MRTFSILWIHDGLDVGGKILSKLPEGSNVRIYAKESLKNSDSFNKTVYEPKNVNITTVFFPDELVQHGSKLRNFVSKDLLDGKIGGFVHIFEDSLEIVGKTDDFLDKIEKMMDIFDLKTWFSTACDECNYVYAKYNPRIYVAIDEDEAKKTYDEIIAWCSNANLTWVCFNLDKCAFEDVRLEEKFDFSMYYIIEFLARRRNAKKPGELNYMNWYPSVKAELDVFKSQENVPETRKFSNDEIKAEGDIFNEMKVDNHPDGNLDELMEDMRRAILKYAESHKNS